MEIRSRYSPRLSVSLKFDPEFQDDEGNYPARSLTQQQFKDECDIRNILVRFRQTGELPPFTTGEAVFADVSTVPEFQDAMNTIARTTEYFESLPSRVRARFNNNPSEYVAFMNDPSNYEEGVKLGLVKPVDAPKAEVTVSPIKEPIKLVKSDSEPSHKDSVSV